MGRPIPLFLLHDPDNGALPEELELMAGAGAVLVVDATTQRVAARWV